MDNFVFVDIEASSLINGYPLEIGWAWREGEDVECASTLIAPPEKWLTEYVWDSVAATVHGLTIENVRRFGDAPRHVCSTLNSLLCDRDLVFDTGNRGADVTWMKMLYVEAGLAPTFGILSVTSDELVRGRAALMGLSNGVYAFMQSLAPQMPHRAAIDAAHWAWWITAMTMHYCPFRI